MLLRLSRQAPPPSSYKERRFKYSKKSNETELPAQAQISHVLVNSSGGTCRSFLHDFASSFLCDDFTSSFLGDHGILARSPSCRRPSR